MGEVIHLPISSSNEDIPPKRILKDACKAELQDVVIIGWDKTGALYFNTSMAASPQILWLMEVAKRGLIEVGSMGND